MRLNLTELDVLRAIACAAGPRASQIYREVERQWAERVKDGGLPPTTNVIASRMRAMKAKGWLAVEAAKDGNLGFTWKLTDRGRSWLAVAKDAA
ncbi:MAG: hypothetical protein QHD01_05980 [Bradyrhizobium sp.]|uniref:hypothetical protein n=1 Tax=Bradyrhizobium sp. TaxID=376 RepID=UPI0029A9A917|nr:hypothetical protein [Bradyrhizobium sp.]MDX3966134.1 hypothetical protein [Bradyrhizobium sp.]